MIKYLCFIDWDMLAPNIVGDFRREKDCSDVPICFIDASRGYSQNVHQAIEAKRKKEEMIIVTNQIGILSHEYGWRDDLGEHERIYIYKNGSFVNIKALTNKEIREYHNIMRMYMNGCFNVTGTEGVANDIAEAGVVDEHKHRAEVADIVISELRAKLSKAEHDRDRYARRITLLQAQKGSREGKDG